MFFYKHSPPIVRHSTILNERNLQQLRVVEQQNQICHCTTNAKNSFKLNSVYNKFDNNFNNHNNNDFTCKNNIANNHINNNNVQLIENAILNSENQWQQSKKKYIISKPSVLGNSVARIQHHRSGRQTTTVVLRSPTITIKENRRIFIDPVPWSSLPLNDQAISLNNKINDDTETTTTSSNKRNKFKTKNNTKKNVSKNFLQYVKILLPHFILVFLLIGYLCFGAWVLIILETKTELLARSTKLIRVTNLIQNFTAESWLIIQNTQTGNRPPINGIEWEKIFKEYMLKLAESIDERRPIRNELNIPDSIENMHNKWTFPTALLYVLTVLTTCGYGEVSVDTDKGKIFSIVFALIGIPLMFITAADIGKFLSETLLKSIKYWSKFIKFLKKSFNLFFYRNKKFNYQKSIQTNNKHQFGFFEFLSVGVDADNAKLWLPISSYVFCICLYCWMGTAIFINWERSWSFIHAFHFGFNLIITVGLGDIVVTNYLFLSLIVAFVIVGLSIVTMCIDLASTHLKAYFTRIHYFGRAFRFFELSDDLREIIALIGTMHKKKNQKVTWDDLRAFLDSELCDRPFEPHELLMKLRFIDETTNSAMNTIRNNSFTSDFFWDVEYLKRLAALKLEKVQFTYK